LNNNTASDRSVSARRGTLMRRGVHRHCAQGSKTFMVLLEKWLPFRKKRSRAVMVVGMHRSGTSFLTGSLQTAGLELGNHSAWNPHNLRGNRENQDIVAFHDRLLAARGFAWDRPPPERVSWTEEEFAEARAIIASYANVPLWGFKDPRALLCVHGWRTLLPELRFVGIFRHPLAVARSLAARGGMPQEQALFLWEHYNRRLLALHDETRFPLLCFDEPEAALHQRLNRVLRTLGLQPLGDERFWSEELRHHEACDEPLPEPQAMLYRELRRRAQLPVA